MFVGHEDLTGQVICGLRVLRIVRRSPELAYSVECTNPGCQAQMTVSHRHLQTGAARCLRGIACDRARPEPVSTEPKRPELDPNRLTVPGRVPW